MVRLTLGPWVSIFAGFVYVFIHYSLLVAYIAEAGDIISDVVNVPKWIGKLKKCFFIMLTSLKMCYVYCVVE